MIALLVALILLWAVPADAGRWSFQQIGPPSPSWSCDGQKREAGRWTADKLYLLKKTSVYIGPDLYGTTEFQSILYWWRIADGTMMPIAINWGERAGLTGAYGTSGSNFTDRFIESLTDVPIAPGDVFIVYASCISYFNNPVFQHPVSFVNTAGYLWLMEIP